MTARTKPSQFEKVATVLCKDHEERLRKILHLDMLLAQVQSKNFLNKEAQQALAEAIEQSINSMRQSMVVVYAEEFDKRYPRLRKCAMSSSAALDERLKYFCAVRD
ncbi:hypothetical protein BCCGELA001_01305 [Bradyrhizobium sp. CCGE-LA001]|nr:hypothetical protein BCCGELA001_01305 [Bradyrhizobium sp. CCGE-LA001]